MASTEREQRIRYDNIAVGSATGPERHVGDVQPAVELAYGAGDNVAVGETGRDPSNTVVGETVNPYLERPGGA